jgi:hypothetical protein
MVPPPFHSLTADRLITGGVLSGVAAMIEPVTDDLLSAVTFGSDQPQRFLARWYGPPSQEPSDPEPSELPQPLVEWRRQVARWGESMVMTQNRVPPTPRWDADVLVVGVETQSMWFWGVRGEDPNPWVLERENEPGTSWTSTGERLDEFLWHFTVVEQVFGSRWGLGAIDVARGQVESFVSGWTRVDARPWRWPGPDSALWVRDHLLAWTMVNGHPGSQVDESSLYGVFVAARRPEDLDRLDDSPIEWDSEDRDD